MQQAVMKTGSAARLATQSGQSQMGLSSVAAGRASKPFMGTASSQRTQHVVRAGAPGPGKRVMYMDRQVGNFATDTFEYEDLENVPGGTYAPTYAPMQGQPTQGYQTQGYPRYPPRQPMGSRQSFNDYLDYEDDEDDDEYDSYGGDFGSSGGSSQAKHRQVNGKQLLINREIKAEEVRVLSGEGGKQQRGVMRTPDALALARDLQVDLVLLNADASPPLCRLVKWSKYKYEVEKEMKKKASKAAVVETKEVRLRPGTDANDLNTKMKSSIKFLEKGNKLKLVMKFEGRELQFKEQGKQLMLKFVEDLGAVGKVDGPINFKTGTYTAILSPTGSKVQGGGAAKDNSQEDTPAPAPAPPAPAVAQADDLPRPPAAPPAGLPMPPPPPPAGLPMPPQPPARPAAGPGLQQPPRLASTPPPMPQRLTSPARSPPPPVMPPSRPATPPPPPPSLIRPGNPPPELMSSPARPTLSRPGTPNRPPPPPPPPSKIPVPASTSTY